MVYVTGDMHGDIKKLKNACRKLKKGDTLLIAGDFGFIWNGGRAEKKTLAGLGKKKYRICFIDGENENFRLLAGYPDEEFCGGTAARISGDLWYLKRGEIYVIEGMKFFCMGGAKSEDIEAKQKAGTWFAEEMPGEEELRRAADNLEKHGYEVDYFLTHQPGAAILASVEAKYIDCDNLQIFLDEAAKRTRYTKWIFGKLHRDRNITYKCRAIFADVIPLGPPGAL